MTTTPTNTLTRQRLQQLAEEATALSEWTTVRDWAAQMYGDKAVKVEIETYGQYDDEGNTDYSIDSITVYDKDDNELHFDHSLPFFSTKAWKDCAKAYGIDSEDEDHSDDFRCFKEVSMSAKEKQRGPWILIDDLPVDEHNGDDETYDLTKEPSLTLPIIA